MIPGIEAIYQRLASLAVSLMSEPWSSLKIEAVYYSASTNCFGEYTLPDGKIRSFPVAHGILKPFDELRALFKEAGQPVWGQACFELFPDGKFHVTWGYDNCDENGDTIFDEETWLRQREEQHRRVTQR